MRIFVASTGRCGTRFMTDVFSLMTDIPSFHENAPYCIGQTSKDINNFSMSSESRKIIEEKIAKVECYQDGYFEANNMFIKSFGWEFIDRFDDLYVIYLHRNPLDTFLSHAERGWKLGWDWLLQPHWKRNYLRCEEGMTYLEAIMWNWYEVRERFFQLKSVFAKTYDFDFRRIEDIDEYRKMFNHFGIEYKDIDELPPLRKNENKAGAPVSDRYLEIISDLNKKWDAQGIEWVFEDK